MYTLYKITRAFGSQNLLDTITLSEVNEYLIYLLEEQESLTKEQAVLLVEFALPVKWTNGKFIERIESEKDITFKSQCGSLFYQIIKP